MKCARCSGACTVPAVEGEPRFGVIPCDWCNGSGVEDARAAAFTCLDVESGADEQPEREQ